MRIAALACVLVAAGAAGSPPRVSIVAPAPGHPVFGEVTLAAVVDGDEVAEVEFHLDGRRVGVVEGPPYTVRAHAGYDNVEHRIRVIARTWQGEVGVAALTTPSIEVNDEVAVELQQLYVTVVDGGERVLDLERGDFEITDDGAGQELVTFEKGDIPFTAVLLVDASASMAGAKLEAALLGAGIFVDRMEPLDEASLVVFSDRQLAATPFLDSDDELAAEVGGVTAQGGTALNDRLYVALKDLERRQGRRVIVVLSDGLDSHSVLEVDDIVAVAERGRALIYWVRLQMDGDRAEEASPASQHSAWRDGKGHARQVDLLERVVARSGGRVAVVGEPDEIPARFAEVLAELRSQYALGYYASTSDDDGRWHPVDVKVRRRGVTVRTASGYFDD